MSWGFWTRFLVIWFAAVLFKELHGWWHWLGVVALAIAINSCIEDRKTA